MFLFCVPYRLFWKCLFNKVFEIMEMLLSDFCMYISFGVYEHRLAFCLKQFMLSPIQQHKVV